MNFVLLVGTVISKVTDKSTPKRAGGVPTASFIMTTNRYWIDKTTMLERSEASHHIIIAFNELVDVIVQRIKPGLKVAVQGQLQYYKPPAGGVVCQVKANLLDILDD